MLNAMKEASSAAQAEQEEQRLLQHAIEESKAMASGAGDPSNPDVDSMTYEQLIELGESAGKVSKGCTG